MGELSGEWEVGNEQALLDDIARLDGPVAPKHVHLLTLGKLERLIGRMLECWRMACWWGSGAVEE